MSISHLLRSLITILLCAGIVSPQAPTKSVPEKAAPEEKKPVSSLKVLVLSTMLADEGIGEWGYAALVEVDGHKILFDTGARPETVLQNARELGVELADIKDVILSHNHDDHTGGLLSLRRALAKRNPTA